MDSAKVCRNFEQEGFRCCILKGQGNALLYPDPYMRTPGDIDIYLEGGRKRIMEYVNRVCPNQVMRCLGHGLRYGRSTRDSNR